MSDDRTCTCHPDDNPPRPCPRKYALHECRDAELDRLRTELATVTEHKQHVHCLLDAAGVPTDPGGNQPFRIARRLDWLRAELDAMTRRAELAEGYAQPYHDEAARLRAGLERARTALLDANSICRSAFAISSRIAVQYGTIDFGTFIGRFSERVHESLLRQHDAILATGGYLISQPADAQEPPA